MRTPCEGAILSGTAITSEAASLGSKDGLAKAASYVQSLTNSTSDTIYLPVHRGVGEVNDLEAVSGTGTL